MSKAKEAIAERPTETLTGIALATAVYGFLTQAGVPEPIAAAVGIVIAFGPAGVSTVVDEIKGAK
jgi:hypothetical protein